MIIKRNMLCLKKQENIDLGELLLWKPYKNILSNFVNLCTDKKAAEFDPVSRVFDGLESVPDKIKPYYEALLGVTSYYQHSQGGRGKYIEKKFATVTATSSLNIKLSEMPFYLEKPELHKKKGIFTLTELSSKEKQEIRNNRWLWKGKADVDIDIGNILKGENAVVLMELKNRTDSGGTAGRREIWTKKFRTILEIFARDEKIFSDGRKEYTLYEILKLFKIRQIELYVGILFNVDGTPSTKDGDRLQGFYSSNVEGFNDILRFISSHPAIFRIAKKEKDEENLKIVVSYRDIKIVIGALYGNQIPQKLFRKDYPVNELLLLKFDDIWLAQLLSIDERTFLLKYGKNFMTIFKGLLTRDYETRRLYNLFIDSEGNIGYLKKLVKYLLEKYNKEFENKLVPNDVTKEQYLADVIFVMASAEA